MIALAQLPLPEPWSFVVPGVLTAVVAGLLVLLGWGLGRRTRERGPRRDILAMLEQLAAGRFDLALRVGADDPDAELIQAIEKLAEALARREHDPEPRRLARLARALDASLDRALLVVDPDFTVTAASAGAGPLLGLQERLEGRGLDELFDPDALAGFLAGLARARREEEGVATARLAVRGGSQEVVVAARWLDGERPSVLVWIEPLPAAAEDARRVAARLRAVLDGLGAGVAIVEDGRIAEANPAARALLGAQAVGRRLADLVAAEDLLLVLDRVGRAARGESVPAFRCHVGGTAGGRPVLVEAEAIGLPAAGEATVVALGLRPVGVPAVESPLIRTREARLLGVLDALPDGVALLTERDAPSGRWRVALVNRAFEELLELDSSEVLGAPEDELAALLGVRVREADAFAEFMRKAAAEPDDEHRRTFAAAPGREDPIELSIVPVHGPADRRLGRVVIVRAVGTAENRAGDAAAGGAGDDLQQAYEELLALHRDLASRTEELSELNRELEELDGFRARLLGEVAHELQSPLVSVRGYTQMLLDGRLGRLNDEQRRGLEATLRNVDRMSELIGNLLALARAEKREPPVVSAVDAGRAVEEVVTRHEGAAGARGVRLEARIDEPEAAVAADPEDLRRVLDNLVGNAIKFTPRGGRASARVAAGPTGFVDLVVEDTGIGIPEDERDRVFETFFRGRGARDAPGTGLGLAMVRRIVERYGAKILVESRVGHGTRFTVRWPRASSAGRTANPGTGAHSA